MGRSSDGASSLRRAGAFSMIQYRMEDQPPKLWPPLRVLLLLLIFLLHLSGETCSSVLVSSSKLDYCKNDVDLNCEKKIVLDLTVINGKIEESDAVETFVTSAQDIEGGMKDLVEPYRITIYKSYVYAQYPLNFVQAFNDYPHEVASPAPNCNDADVNSMPNCGWLHDKFGGRVPHSQGFCCLCSFKDKLPKWMGGTKSNRRFDLECSFQTLTGQLPWWKNGSVHCLRYSNKWYPTYEIQEPNLKLSIQVVSHLLYSDTKSLYKAKHKENTPLKVSTLQTVHVNSERSMKANLQSDLTNCIKPPTLNSLYLSIPNQEWKGDAIDDPNQWLALEKSNYTLNGSECYKIGLSVKAFRSQSDPCLKEFHSCCGKQLKLYAEEEARSLAATSMPVYSISHYGKILSDVLDRDTGHLRMEILLNQTVTSTVTLELEADNVDLHGKWITGRILSAIGRIESRTRNGILYLKVTNIGRLTANFTIEVGMCSSGMEYPPARKVTLPAPAVTSQYSFDLLNTDAIDSSYSCRVSLFDNKGDKQDHAEVVFDSLAPWYGHRYKFVEGTIRADNASNSSWFGGFCFGLCWLFGWGANATNSSGNSSGNWTFFNWTCGNCTTSVISDLACFIRNYCWKPIIVVIGGILTTVAVGIGIYLLWQADELGPRGAKMANAIKSCPGRCMGRPPASAKTGDDDDDDDESENHSSSDGSDSSGQKGKRKRKGKSWKKSKKKRKGGKRKRKKKKKGFKLSKKKRGKKKGLLAFVRERLKKKRRGKESKKKKRKGEFSVKGYKKHKGDHHKKQKKKNRRDMYRSKKKSHKRKDKDHKGKSKSKKGKKSKKSKKKFKMSKFSLKRFSKKKRKDKKKKKKKQERGDEDDSDSHEEPKKKKKKSNMYSDSDSDGESKKKKKKKQKISKVFSGLWGRWKKFRGKEDDKASSDSDQDIEVSKKKEMKDDDNHSDSDSDFSNKKKNKKKKKVDDHDSDSDLDSSDNKKKKKKEKRQDYDYDSDSDSSNKKKKKKKKKKTSDEESEGSDSEVKMKKEKRKIEGDEQGSSIERKKKKKDSQDYDIASEETDSSSFFGVSRKKNKKKKKSKNKGDKTTLNPEDGSEITDVSSQELAGEDFGKTKSKKKTKKGNKKKGNVSTEASTGSIAGDGKTAKKKKKINKKKGKKTKGKASDAEIEAKRAERKHRKEMRGMETDWSGMQQYENLQQPGYNQDPYGETSQQQAWGGVQQQPAYDQGPWGGMQYDPTVSTEHAWGGVQPDPYSQAYGYQDPYGAPFQTQAIPEPPLTPPVKVKKQKRGKKEKKKKKMETDVQSTSSEASVSQESAGSEESLVAKKIKSDRKKKKAKKDKEATAEDSHSTEQLAYPADEIPLFTGEAAEPILPHDSEEVIAQKQKSAKKKKKDKAVTPEDSPSTEQLAYSADEMSFFIGEEAEPILPHEDTSELQNVPHKQKQKKHKTGKGTKLGQTPEEVAILIAAKRAERKKKKETQALGPDYYGMQALEEQALSAPPLPQDKSMTNFAGEETDPVLPHASPTEDISEMPNAPNTQGRKKRKKETGAKPVPTLQELAILIEAKKVERKKKKEMETLRLDYPGMDAPEEALPALSPAQDDSMSIFSAEATESALPLASPVGDISELPSAHHKQKTKRNKKENNTGIVQTPEELELLIAAKRAERKRKKANASGPDYPGMQEQEGQAEAREVSPGPVPPQGETPMAGQVSISPLSPEHTQDEIPITGHAQSKHRKKAKGRNLQGGQQPEQDVVNEQVQQPGFYDDDINTMMSRMFAEGDLIEPPPVPIDKVTEEVNLPIDGVQHGLSATPLPIPIQQGNVMPEQAQRKKKKGKRKPQAGEQPDQSVVNQQMHQQYGALPDDVETDTIFGAMFAEEGDSALGLIEPPPRVGGDPAMVGTNMLIESGQPATPATPQARPTQEGTSATRQSRKQRRKARKGQQLSLLGPNQGLENQELEQQPRLTVPDSQPGTILTTISTEGVESSFGPTSPTSRLPSEFEQEMKDNESQMVEQAAMQPLPGSYDAHVSPPSRQPSHLPPPSFTNTPSISSSPLPAQKQSLQAIPQSSTSSRPPSQVQFYQKGVAKPSVTKTPDVTSSQLPSQQQSLVGVSQPSMLAPSSSTHLRPQGAPTRFASSQQPSYAPSQPTGSDRPLPLQSKQQSLQAASQPSKSSKPSSLPTQLRPQVASTSNALQGTRPPSSRTNLRPPIPISPPSPSSFQEIQSRSRRLPQPHSPKPQAQSSTRPQFSTSLPGPSNVRSPTSSGERGTSAEDIKNIVASCSLVYFNIKVLKLDRFAKHSDLIGHSISVIGTLEPGANGMFMFKLSKSYETRVKETKDKTRNVTMESVSNLPCFDQLLTIDQAMELITTHPRFSCINKI